MLYTHNDLETKKDQYRYCELMINKEMITNAPGIYIWRYSPTFNKINLLESLKNITNLNVQILSKFEDSFYKVEVKKKYFKESDNLLGLSKSKENTLIDIINQCNSENKQDIISNLFQSIFSHYTPLYVGKASNLRERLKTHIDRKSNLLDDIEKIGIDPLYEVIIETISIKYETELIKDNENIFEEILQRITAPILSKRYG